MGSSETTLYRWIMRFDVDEGRRAGATSAELAELAQLCKDQRRLEQENEILRRATAYFPRDLAPNDVPAGPRGRRDRIPVTVTCGVLGLCRQAYYRWLASPVRDRDWDEGHTLDGMLTIHADDPEFSYRFMVDEFDRAGQRTGQNHLQRLCAQQQLYSTTTRKGRRTKRARPPVYDDLVQRESVSTSSTGGG